MTKVLTLKFGSDDAKERAEIHFLNVGDTFEGFGGSRHVLTAGRDFAIGQKQLILTLMEARDLQKLLASKIKRTRADSGDDPYWRALDKRIEAAMKPAEGIAALRRSASWRA